MELKLFAFHPGGHGEKSFFVVAADEDEARDAVDAEIARRWALPSGDVGRFDSCDCGGWGTDYYHLTVVQRGEVVFNDND